MRVYELAKEAGVSSVDVLKAAESCGAEVSSAISSIDGDDLATLKQAVAELQGKGDVALGNVVGSNICNITVILGLSALIAPIKVNRQMLKLTNPRQSPYYKRGGSRCRFRLCDCCSTNIHRNAPYPR